MKHYRNSNRKSTGEKLQELKIVVEVKEWGQEKQSEQQGLGKVRIEYMAIRREAIGQRMNNDKQLFQKN